MLRFRCLIAALCLLAHASSAQSTAFTYQGRLKDAGSPASGLHDFRFRLFDAASAGTQVGTTQCVDNLQVVEGMFTATIDFGNQFTTPTQRFIEVEVRRDSGLTCADTTGYTTLTTRQLIAATPTATHAKSAFALDAADGSPASVVFVDNVGNVGIGTTTPAAKLHVRDGDLLAGASGEEWIFHTRSSFAGDFLHITDLDAGVPQFQRGITIDESGHVGLRNGVQSVFATGGVENLRIIRGLVNNSGTVLAGQGFSVSHPSTGHYTITLATPMTDRMVVVVTAGGPVGRNAVANATSGTITVETEFQGQLADVGFNFIAVGPR